MNSGFYPKVENPKLTNNIPQMKSGASQVPFFFGGSQTPVDLGLPAGSFSGSGMCGKGKCCGGRMPMKSAVVKPNDLGMKVPVLKGRKPMPVVLPFKR